MADIASLTLTHLRRIDERLDRLGDDMREVKGRLGMLEQGVAAIDMRFATIELRVAGVSNRVDRIDSRLDRIERRLELTDPASQT